MKEGDWTLRGDSPEPPDQTGAVGAQVVLLIRVVSTVALTVTHPGVHDALAAAALEVLRPTCTVAILLVRFIRAVRVFVAHPFPVTDRQTRQTR